METHYPTYQIQQEHVKAKNKLDELVNELSHVFLPWELENLVVMGWIQALLAERVKNVLQGNLAIPDYPVDDIPNQVSYITE